MTFITKIAAAALMTVSLLAAADDAPRKEAVLDTGKGGLHIVVSVPNFAQGPYDFAKNPGPKNNKFDNGNYSEVMFNAPVGDEKTVAVYEVNAINRLISQKGAVPVTPQALAKDKFINEGFTMERATPIDNPELGIPGASIGTYKASGFAMFDGKEDHLSKVAIIVMSIALKGQNQGFTFSTKIAVKDIQKFDADPAKYERAAFRMFNDLLKNSAISKN